MKKAILVCVFVLFSKSAFASDKYISLGLDNSSAQVIFFNTEQIFEWGGGEINFVQEFDKDKLFVISGWSAGVRKQSPKLERETYITLGLFKDFDDFVGLGPTKWDIRLWGQAIYGLPGNRFNRSGEKYDSQGFIGYYRTYLVTDFHVPGQRVSGSGVLYPSAAVSLERDFGKINIEPMLGVRFMKFGFVETERNSLKFVGEKWIVGPTYGIRFGYKF